MVCLCLGPTIVEALHPTPPRGIIANTAGFGRGVSGDPCDFVRNPASLARADGSPQRRAFGSVGWKWCVAASVDDAARASSLRQKSTSMYCARSVSNCAHVTLWRLGSPDHTRKSATLLSIASWVGVCTLNRCKDVSPWLKSAATSLNFKLLGAA